jgi:FkbM family methyltransferase
VPIPLSKSLKTRAQSALPLISSGLVRQSTEAPLSAITAFLLGIRGLGWPPATEIEAKAAAGWVKHDDFVVIDAGANIGEWASFFSKHVSVDGRIFAIEPQDDAANQIRARNLPRCQVCQFALSSKNGTAKFYSSGATDKMASLYERDDSWCHLDGQEYIAVEIPTIRLDDFVKERDLQRVDFLKMDLEGAELDALAGARESIESGLIRAVSFEFGVSNVNSRTFFRDYYVFFAKYHYEVYRLTPGGGLLRVKEYSEDDEVFSRTSTYFARAPQQPLNRS